jgi:2-oxoglutarate dehydrogenase E1 component
MDPEQKRWIQERVEGVKQTMTVEQQHRVLEALNEAEVFEKFLHSRYVGQKRFGLEGGESTIVALQTILDVAADEGLREAVIGMAHRGRLNVLANIVGKSYSDIFSEFEGNLDPESVQGSGDVKYHKGSRGTFKNPRGAAIEVSMASNPSHLDPVTARNGTRWPRSFPTWRFSSTVTPLSRVRVWSPRPSTCPNSRATASGDRFTS